MTCNEVIEAYLATLRDGFHCESDIETGRLSVVSPFLYPDHDYIEVFVRENDGRIAVSDLGESLRRLDTLGMDVCGTPGMLYAAKRIAGGLSVEIENGVLVKRGEPKDAGRLVFDVLSAVNLVSSLVFGNRAYEPKSFDQEVIEFLDGSGFEVEPDAPLTGKSGTAYKVTCKVVRKNQPPAFVKTLSPKTKGSIRPQINATYRLWADVVASPQKEEKFSLLDDDVDWKSPFRPADVKLLTSVSNVHMWTKRGALLEALARP